MATDNASTPRTRRRGEALETAIHAAVLAELDEVGYARLTVEGIAARARTGKAALYRRWSSKQDMVVAALRHTLPDPQEFDHHCSTRDNLLAALTVMAEVLAGHRAFPGFAVFGDVLREPALRVAVVEKLIMPRLEAIVAIVRQGASNGEIDPSAPESLLARTGPALILQQFILTGEAPDQAEIAGIVDDILMPLLRRPTTTETDTPEARSRQP
ncbi:TetR/AcrR family transcriptional regulator [Saccharopolyspora erythraea]|uniref:TetR/AcrR family transcriptional regulator n=1 Tax=Saccharopolyspora erythraea TaxID=1836 RepID=UPI001BA5ADC8|nr:TetR/AcrR family transcriptional regulator [Saccharopolyspora erythraea]QUH04006.1 TetR/AcrR family transcriptional regulator [Saccharopolyspora erythraea]